MCVCDITTTSQLASQRSATKRPNKPHSEQENDNQYDTVESRHNNDPTHWKKAGQVRTTQDEARQHDVRKLRQAQD